MTKDNSRNFNARKESPSTYNVLLNIYEELHDAYKLNKKTKYLLRKEFTLSQCTHNSFFSKHKKLKEKLTSLMKKLSTSYIELEELKIKKTRIKSKFSNILNTFSCKNECLKRKPKFYKKGTLSLQIENIR